MVKYPHWVQKLPYYTTQHEPYWFSTNVCISEADYG